MAPCSLGLAVATGVSNHMVPGFIIYLPDNSTFENLHKIISGDKTIAIRINYIEGKLNIFLIQQKLPIERRSSKRLIIHKFVVVAEIVKEIVILDLGEFQALLEVGT